MIEGQVLKQFIDNQHKSKISIAQDLDVSKQTLFNYFKSKEISPEIKQKLEAYFGKVIFTKQAADEIIKRNLSKALKAVNNDMGNPITVNNDDYIESLKAQIKLLDQHNVFLQEKITRLETELKQLLINSNSILNNQNLLMRQVKASFGAIAEMIAEGNLKKIQKAENTWGKLLNVEPG